MEKQLVLVWLNLMINEATGGYGGELAVVGRSSSRGHCRPPLSLLPHIQHSPCHFHWVRAAVWISMRRPSLVKTVHCRERNEESVCETSWTSPRLTEACALLIRVTIYHVEFVGVCFLTRRTWFSVQTQTLSRSAPRIWTAPWAKPPGPLRRLQRR